MSPSYPIPSTYTRPPREDVRRQIREVLEKFELPVADLPPPDVSIEGQLTYALPYPAQLGFRTLVRLLAENAAAITARDDDAYRLTLNAGAVFEFWPQDDNTARLTCSSILAPGDDALTGRRFQEVLATITLLTANAETIRAQAAEAVQTEVEAAMARTFSENQLMDLANAIALLRHAGFTVILKRTAPDDFLALASLSGDVAQSFSSLDAFLAYARAIAAPHQPASAPEEHSTGPIVKRRSVLEKRRKPAFLSTFLLLIGLALLALLFFYPWPS